MISGQITHRTLINYNEEFGHLYVPNLVMRQPFSEKPYFIRTNSQGFRSDFDFEKQNKNKEQRIVFLGDSFTAGDGVSNEMRFSDLASKAFGAKSYNFGLSGSGVDQQALIYKKLGSEYEHDVLVISPHIEDISRNMLSERASIDAGGKQILVPKPYFTIENNSLVRHNIIVPKERKTIESQNDQNKLIQPSDNLRKMFHEHVPKKVKEKLLKVQFSKKHAGYEDENSAEWILMKKLLEMIIENAGNKPILLAPLPYHRIGMNPDYKDRFKDLAKRYKNVVFVDVLDKFSSVKDTDQLYFAKDKHYSEFGHKVIADAITEKIEQEKILKRVISETESNTSPKATYILGISAFYHDSAASLIKDGEIIASAQEERFTRLKNDSRFPKAAVNFCLEEAGISMNDITAVAFYDDPNVTLERIILSQLSVFPKGNQIWEEVLPKWVQTKLHIPQLISSELDWKGDIHFVKHHQSHAASTFYPSPFLKSAILTIDGVGEWATATIGVGDGNTNKILREMSFPDSVGLLYSAFTYYTGFKVNEGEYKLMGLAPYGEPTYAGLIKEKIVKIHDDGSITLNQDYFSYREKPYMVNEKFEELFDGPARKDNELITKRIRDIARSIQVVTEEIILKMAVHAKKLTGCENLCLAGGVALNCVANGKLIRENIFKDIWIQPAAGDSGGALGAALSVFYEKYNSKNIQRKEGVCSQKGSFWGPSFSNSEIKAYLDSFNFKYTQVDPEKRNHILAKYLAEGKIVGHFSGRMEFGPRSLGARSILADPRSETAQSTLNLKIKYRESFRPFAPAVLREKVSEYFEFDKSSPYMLFVAPVKKERCIAREEGYENDLIKIVNKKRSDLPAITHIDYSARIQTITKEENPVFFDLVSEFEKLTNYGVVINTSFNVNSEPIVCTPKDAVSCFMNTEMDVLALNDFILLKTEQTKEKIAGDKNIPSALKTKTAKNKSKLQKIAKGFSDKYFSGLKNNITKQYTSAGDSSWEEAKNYSTTSVSPQKPLNVSSILKEWEVLPENIKQQFIPLLNDMIILSEKYKISPEEIDSEISDSTYVMF